MNHINRGVTRLLGSPIEHQTDCRGWSVLLRRPVWSSFGFVDVIA